MEPQDLVSFIQGEVLFPLYRFNAKESLKICLSEIKGAILSFNWDQRLDFHKIKGIFENEIIEDRPPKLDWMFQVSCEPFPEETSTLNKIDMNSTRLFHFSQLYFEQVTLRFEIKLMLSNKNIMQKINETFLSLIFQFHKMNQKTTEFLKI